ncbi:MAG: hypothetical protein NC253_05420 [Ruminococcus sp.]|nr:hypothetical protein [Ruminococcus sp.]MCM1381811.1 hypothetical protein [Muribaculaceae bacterium]MCM1478269.1 hypothetical protein [Muribaculaceae bacterium]
MIPKKELLKSIAECEENVNTFQRVEKLAALYIIYEHQYGEKQAYAPIPTETETVVEVNGDSNFQKVVNGKDAGKVWEIMSELMESVQLIQPRLYDAVIRKIKEL